MKKLSMLLCAFALIGCEEKESAKNIVAERKQDVLGNAEFKDDVVTDSQDSRIVGYWAMDVTKALAAYDNLPESYESSAAERSEISQSSLGDGPIYHFKENGEVRMYFGSGVNLATYELHAEEGRDATIVIETEGEGAESMTLSAKDDSLRMILPEEAPPVAGIFVLSRVPFAKVAKDIAKVEEKAAYWDNLRAERQAERVGFDGHWVPDLEATEATLKRRKPSQQKERPTEEVMRALQEDFQRNPTTVFFDSDNILKVYDNSGEDKMTYGTVEYALGLGNEVHITIDGDWVFTMEDSQLVWNNRYWEITGLAAGVVMKRIAEVEAKRRITEGAQSSEEASSVEAAKEEVEAASSSPELLISDADVKRFAKDALNPADAPRDYTGWTASYFDKAGTQLSELAQMKNGKPDGPTILYYETGKIMDMSMWKSGEMVSRQVFYPTGEKMVTTSPAVAGALELSGWHKNGQRASAVLIKDGGVIMYDGAPMLRKFWNEEGEELDQEEGLKMMEQLQNQLRE